MRKLSIDQKKNPKFVHGVDKNTDITPESLRSYAWTVEYESPDYHAPEFSGTGPDLALAHRGRGVRVSLAQNDGESDVVIVHASARPSQTPVVDGCALGIVIDGDFVSVHELEAFATALSATVAEAKRSHPEMWNGGKSRSAALSA